MTGSMSLPDEIPEEHQHPSNDIEVQMTNPEGEAVLRKEGYSELHISKENMELEVIENHFEVDVVEAAEIFNRIAAKIVAYAEE